MSYLLDTNVLSELRRKAPDPAVAHWISQRPARSLFLSVLTLGEIRKGIDSLQDTPKRQILSDWLEAELPAYFQGRILPIDQLVGDRWGRLLAKAGRPLPTIDSLLAATAAAHGLCMVTRNTRDFEGLGIDLFNPWSGSD
ncbi:MAG: type II toxin-antitoxin system VapC family toxin [Curvibacter sp.]|nr:type II toxin-antitoxin system VapC family toxin [Curvibacter sp.]